MRLLERIMLLLVAANILMLLWGVVRMPAHQLQQVRDGSLASLTHLSEVQDVVVVTASPGLAEISAESDAVSSDPAGLLFERCFMRGPFDSDDAARTAMSGSDIAFSVRSVRESIAAAPLYRAMIAPSANLAEAQQRLSEVATAIERTGVVIDTYLVTTGPIANAVSLGLFSERSNALNVQRVLADQGVEVTVEPELRIATRYWVVANDADAVDIVNKNAAVPVFDVVPAELSENLCEMIAQAE